MFRVNADLPRRHTDTLDDSLGSNRRMNSGDPEAVGRAYRTAIPIGRYVTAEEIANVALFLCSDLAASVTGDTLHGRWRPDFRVGFDHRREIAIPPSAKAAAPARAARRALSSRQSAIP